jgi:excisionase family DNA binding protein
MREEDPVLKVPEVARRLRVSPETVRRWLRDGELRGVRFSDRGGWRVLSSEVERKLRGEASPAWDAQDYRGVREQRVAEPSVPYRAGDDDRQPDPKGRAA